MNKTLSYKGYIGDVEFSAEDNCFFGEILGTQSMITYEGTSVEEITADFHNAVDSYLEMCERRGIKPEKSFKGSFIVRLEPELHREIAIMACNEKISLNKFVKKSLKNATRTEIL
jgi:predicted HicB family RNase H-like nuclease